MHKQSTCVFFVSLNDKIRQKVSKISSKMEFDPAHFSSLLLVRLREEDHSDNALVFIDEGIAQVNYIIRVDLHDMMY